VIVISQTLRLIISGVSSHLLWNTILLAARDCRMKADHWKQKCPRRPKWCCEPGGDLQVWKRSRRGSDLKLHSFEWPSGGDSLVASKGQIVYKSTRKRLYLIYYLSQHSKYKRIFICIFFILFFILCFIWFLSQYLLYTYNVHIIFFAFAYLENQ